MMGVSRFGSHHQVGNDAHRNASWRRMTHLTQKSRHFEKSRFSCCFFRQNQRLTSHQNCQRHDAPPCIQYINNKHTIHARLHSMICCRLSPPSSAGGGWWPLLPDSFLINTNTTRTMPTINSVQVDTTATTGDITSPISQKSALDVSSTKQTSRDRRSQRVSRRVPRCPHRCVPMSEGQGRYTSTW